MASTSSTHAHRLARSCCPTIVPSSAVMRLHFLLLSLSWVLVPMLADAQVTPSAEAAPALPATGPEVSAPAKPVEAPPAVEVAPEPSQGREASQPKEVANWIAERERFVVAVERGERTGSGLLIGSEGLVLTARSVIDTPGALRVWADGDEPVEARVIVVDEDLAVLRITEGKLPHGFSLAKERPVFEVGLGEELVILSLPIGIGAAGLRVLPARHPPMPAFLRATRVEPDRIYAEGRFGSGAAGAAVFTRDGALLGINTGDPTLPFFMLGRIADARTVLERAQHPDQQPVFKAKASRALEGGLGVTFGGGGIGIDDRFGFRRNHLLLSVRATLTWKVIEPERTSIFVAESRFFVMPAIGATWKLQSGRLSTSLGAALGSVHRERTVVNDQGTRSEGDDQPRIRPMLDITLRDGYLFISSAVELWRDPTLFLSIGLNMDTALKSR